MIFKKIVDYPDYLINANGIVKKIASKYRKERIMTPQKWVNGYFFICLRNKNGRKGFSIHRLVAIHFIPNTKNKPCVNHINGSYTDNRVENLEWCTHSENSKHAVATGLATPPVYRKLDDFQINVIKMICYQKINLSKVARYFNVSPTTIYDIKYKQSWTHI